MSRLRALVSWQALGLGALLLACGDRAAQAPDVAVTDSAGVPIVENRGQGWESQASWVRSEAPTLSIGAPSGADAAALFAFPSSVAKLSDGRLVVLESQAAEVRWFDLNGAHLMTRGGRGQGPGEFGFPTGMRVLAGDTILVDELRGFDRTYFTSSGDLVREEALDHASLRQRIDLAECGQGMLPDGSVLVCEVLPAMESPSGDPGPGRHRAFSRFMRVAPDLAVLARLGLYGGVEQWGVEYGGRTDFTLHPFFSSTNWAARTSPFRVAIATNPDYSIEVWDDDGRLDRIVRRIDARRPPSAEEEAEANESFLRFARGDEALANRFAAEAQVPELVPAVYDLVFAETGELWVGRSPDLPSTSASIYDVFDSEGVFLGDVEFPARFDVHEVGADYVLGVRRDRLDVPLVEQYRLTRTH